MERKRINPFRVFKGLVTDSGGRIIGRYEAKGNDLLTSQLKIVREFLLNISKQGEDSAMSKNGNERINMVFIAGEIKTIKVREEECFVLIDCEMGKQKTKYIACTVYQSKELSDLLSGFQEGDFIKLVGFCRGWSQKKNDEWTNHMDIRITEIRTKPPARIRSEPVKAGKEDYPF